MIGDGQAENEAAEGNAGLLGRKRDAAMASRYGARQQMAGRRRCDAIPHADREGTRHKRGRPAGQRQGETCGREQHLRSGSCEWRRIVR